MENIHTLPTKKTSMAIIGRSPELAFGEETLRQLGYQVMDGVTSYLSGIRERPVLDIEAVHWPKEKEELHTLRVSHSIARKKLRSLEADNQDTLLTENSTTFNSGLQYTLPIT